MFLFQREKLITESSLDNVDFITLIEISLLFIAIPWF